VKYTHLGLGYNTAIVILRASDEDTRRISTNNYMQGAIWNKSCA
jgi:hypothetical protein